MNTRAFTLIEALATLLVVAIVIPSVLGAVSVATRAAAVTTSRAEAMLLAESKLEEILATRDWMDGSAEGDFAYSASGEPLAQANTAQQGPRAYRWELIVEDSLDLTLRQLRLRVTWEQRNHEHAVELVTLVREGG